MSEPLLSTKLFKPSPYPDLVARPFLIDKLQEGSRGILTLVSAPAGYGKTTLVSEWIRQSPNQSSWLSLDEADNDVARYFSYLIAALQEIHPAIGAEIRPILEADTIPPIEQLLTALVNDIANNATEFTLILDDYHVIHEIKIHQALDFLLDHTPPGMHTVIVTRVDPPMALGRLRAHGALTELREAELRFSLKESAAYFNERIGLSLSPQDLRKLDERIEGWIAGLQLAALTLQGSAYPEEQINAVSGSHRHLIDYLVDEVLSRQPEAVQKFLLHISVLDKFNPSLCDFVTKEQNSGEILQSLLAANLFLIPLDEKGHWYRFHHLFADFLRQRLRSTQAEIIPDLFIRASEWYEANGDVEAAIEHALAGGADTRAARLLDEIAESLLIVDAAVNKLINWAQLLPIEVRRDFPRLCVYHAWALQFEYKLEAAEQMITLAEEHKFDPTRLPQDYSANNISDHAIAIRAYIAFHRGDYSHTVDLCLSALATLTQEDTRATQIAKGSLHLGLGIAYFELGQLDAAKQAVERALPLNLNVNNRYAALSCLTYLIYINLALGDLSQVYAHCEKGFFWIEEWSREVGRHTRPMRMLAHLRWHIGRVQYERNQLNQAALNLTKAVEYYDLVQSWWRVQGFEALVKLYQAKREIKSASDYLSKLKRIALKPEPVPSEVLLEVTIAERNLGQYQLLPDREDLLDGAANWAKSLNLRSSEASVYNRENESLVLAQVLNAQGKPEEAGSILASLIQAAGEGNRRGDLIRYLAVQAISLQGQNRVDTALETLTRALKIGEPEGYVRTFVDLGLPMRDLLLRAARQGIASGYVAKLLEAFPMEEHPPAHEAQADSLIEPLNEREVQILQLMAAGLSDRAIAEALYLSINTVKWYDRQIYSKLGVNRRGEAVAKGRELGLLT